MTRISTYAEAGVDRKLEEASVNALLATVKSKLVNKTNTTGDGAFAGSIELGDNILSLATDGVGTKVLLADELGIYNTIGIDCVAMNVNDLLASGSIPAAFVDYIAIREPSPEKISSIVEGVVEGCNQAEIPLLGGETAILPEIIQGPNNHFDLAGTALGVSSKSKPVFTGSINEGDVIIGISSSGVHSNGLTLARKLYAAHEVKEKEELLKPTRIYVKTIKNCIEAGIEFHAMAHITGGGLRNLLRLGAYHYKLDKWKIPNIFLQLKKRGNIEDKELYTTFNMGIGFIIIISEKDVELALNTVQEHFTAFVIGKVESSDKPMVTLNGIEFGVGEF